MSARSAGHVAARGPVNPRDPFGLTTAAVRMPWRTPSGPAAVSDPVECAASFLVGRKPHRIFGAW
jgi:hypothetical protein